ncbi:MAG: hypothetical protein HS127_08180 [Planctomycetia bacterium]|jgi:hypothetical protein|uniref:hypothetical protein n=1 Tax=Candidatus Kuenenia sp. TaxID=2499824 RepID=UPI001E088B70|nr:hypothetical protein [Planctomycetia bacterium]MCL4743618.1 hypothetical protein [Phycisphaerales bacterium]
MGKTFFTMLMDAGLHRELKILAVENGVSMRCLIERGIGIILDREKKENEFAKRGV